MSKRSLSARNFDIKEKRKVGFGHIQKTNIFNKVPTEPDYCITNKESLAEVAKHHTERLIRL